MSEVTWVWNELSTGEKRKVLSDLVGETVQLMKGSGCCWMYGTLGYRITENNFVHITVYGQRCGAEFYVSDIYNLAKIPEEEAFGIWIN